LNSNFKSADYDYEPQSPTPKKDGIGASSENKKSKNDYDFSEDYSEDEEGQKGGGDRKLKTALELKSSRSMNRKLRAAIAA